ncbi:MAG: o-succinylbenzoate--CoA ligase [Deltaproteobacteria bacterium]|nr:o-succinylbenzoate--CoA ligase [Deltaproteobacteria bacterium]
MRNNVGLLLSKRAHLSPTLEGVVEVERGRRFTFAALNARANRSAHALAALGVGKGDRVALLLMNGVEYVESFFAIAKLGAIVVPLNWRLVADELAFILQDSGAAVLVFDPELREVVAELHRRGAATAVRAWVQTGDPADALPFATGYDAIQERASDTEPAIGASDDDALYIMYTSGTTGLPKGVVHTHRSVLFSNFTIAMTADVRYRDRYVIVLPLFHVGALTPLTGNVHRGMTTILMRAFDPRRMFETIERERATTLLAVPAMLNFMLQVPDSERYDCASLRWIMSGAAPVPVTLIEAYAKRGIEVHQVYGLTESCGPACLISPEDALAKAGSTGKAFFHTDVRVVDEGGHDVAPGGVGEVLVRGAHVMQGYWNRPDATAETIRDGWLHTGDLATIDAEGFVYIADRKKDMIISGGENIYPAEIENVILSCPRVRDVAVIGQVSPKWGESPLAIVVKGDAALAEADVLAHCQGKLARFKQPKAVRFVDEIPRNPAGKILKRILRERFPEPAAE